MKILSILIPLALLAVMAGCESTEPRQAARTTTVTQTTASASTSESTTSIPSVQPKPTSVREIVTDKATYTIEVIPNTRLTPTSREGDQTTNRVYSSNIIAVYVRTNNSVTVNSTNASAVPAPASNAQPPNE